jgi:Fic family protein
MTLNPFSIDDFLKAHKLMTEGLVKESGKFRSGDVGVFDGDRVVHIGARPQFVHPLMEELFAWARESDLHPVLKSAILHYEIETIHPFEDGNGRMGRLWQTLVLAQWNSMFAWIPMESILFQSRPDYYQAIETARSANDSGVFIEFTLSALLDSIKLQDKHHDEHQDEHQVELSAPQRAVMQALEGKSLSRKEIFVAIGLSGDSRAFKRTIEPLMSAGLVERTLPDSPTSRLQKYRLTGAGKALVDGSIR